MDRDRLPDRLPVIGRGGYSLIEVIVAMLITCVMVTAVMGVALTSQRKTSKNMHQMMFDQGISWLSAEVQQYVTACGCLRSTPAYSCLTPPPSSAPVNSCAIMTGPNPLRSGVATWYLNGAPGANGGTLTDSQGDIWALAIGLHAVTGVVPTLEAPPYNGSITYDVKWPYNNGVPQVTFNATWVEPQ